MILTLEITGPQGAKLGSEGRKLFRATGGTIGRLADNDWVLGDRYVSSVHARVHYSNGVFRIEDAGSTNGVYVNSAKLVPGQPQVVRTGDLILIEPYEIRATIGSAVAEPAPYAHDPFAATSGAAAAGGPLDDLFAPVSPPRAPSPAWPASPDQRDQFAPPDSDLIPGDRSQVVDPLAALGLADEPSRRQAQRADELQHRPVVHDHYRPPRVVPGEPAPSEPAADVLPPLLIPDDYDPLKADSGSFRIPTPASERPPQRRSVVPTPSHAPRPHVPTPPAPPSVPRPGQHSVSAPSRAAAPDPAPTPGAAEPTLAAVLAAAGLRDVPVTDELAQDFGRILRVVVEGVIELLRSRQQLKEEFRLGMTTFGRADNNPLKFSANADHALQMLLAVRAATFLPPVAAFEEAFRDIRDHQLAMLEGMRAGFEKMLQEFEPGRLQEEFDRQSKSALVAKPAKMRYWELYCVRIHDMVRDADATFRKLFGDDFANAYEEQARRLKSQNRSGQT